ncbi:histidine kinase [Dysgonomonas alginatilytica]|uniref:histidine kinase n=1 Tax=Dysgonomonas alginatilytica TaxID=1605892 RepID=A0A2V3PP65_9BACT|nr:tetratricopeptide repeat-containing sensor histidine kinase [Dysgonomonas alginatilytica]PXV65006.1 histidine kinase [Dysgonomonas alginatilytica]
MKIAKHLSTLIVFVIMPVVLLSQDLATLHSNAEKNNNAKGWNDLAEFVYFKRVEPELLKESTDKALKLATQQNDKKEQARAYLYASDLFFQEGDIINYLLSNRKVLSILTETKEYSLKEEAYNNMATAYGEQDKIDSLLFYTKKAIALNLQYQGNKLQLGNEYQNMSYAYSIRGATDSSLIYTKKTIGALKEAKDTLRMLDAYNQMAVIYVKNKDYPNALKYFEDALQIYDKVENKHNRLYIYTNLAAMYQKWGKQDKAIEFSRKAVIDAANSNEKLTYGKLLCNLGGHLYKSKLYRSSIDTLQLAMPHIKESHYYLGTAYQTLARDYFAVKNIDSCEYFLNLVDNLAEKNQFSRGELFYASKADILVLQSKYKEAVPLVAKFIELDSKKELKDADPSIYNMVADVLEKGAGDYKRALEYRTLAYAMQDSLYKKESDAKLNEFYALYKTADKDLEISKLNEEKQLMRFNIALMIGGFIITAILLVLFFLYNRLKQLRLMGESRKKQIQSYLEGLESERYRLAKELHDNISNEIVTLKMKMEVEHSNRKTMIDDLQTLHTNVRNISHELMPPIFKYTPLTDILRNYTEQQNQLDKAKILLDIKPEEGWEDMSSELAVEIYRIVQEAVGNAQKYSKATHIYTMLTKNDKEIRIQIKDNGIGFDQNKVFTGFGLKTIKERTNFINGTLLIESDPQHGTDIKVVAPIN